MARTKTDDHYDDDDLYDEEEGRTSPTRAGTAVCLATGISITLLGLALIVLRTQGFGERVDSLTALGLGPGLFLATGLMIVVAAFLLREIGHIGNRVDEVHDTAEDLFEAVEESAEKRGGSRGNDDRHTLLRSLKALLEEKTKGIVRDVHQNLEQTGNLEMEINGATESLRSITNRLDTLRRTQEEAFAALQTACVPDEQARQQQVEQERRFTDRLDALERSVEEAVATVRAIESLCIPLPERMQSMHEATDGRFDALIAAMDGLQANTPGEFESGAWNELRERLDRLEPLIQGDTERTLEVQRELHELRPVLENVGASAGQDPEVAARLADLEREIAALRPTLETMGSASEPNSNLENHLASLQRTCETIHAAVQKLAHAAPATGATNTAQPQPPTAKPQGTASAVMDSIAKLRSMRG